MSVLGLQVNRLRLWNANHPKFRAIASAAIGGIVIALFLTLLIWAAGGLFEVGPWAPPPPPKEVRPTLLGSWQLGPLSPIPSSVQNQQHPKQKWPADVWTITSTGDCTSHLCLYQVSGLSENPSR